LQLLRRRPGRLRKRHGGKRESKEDHQPLHEAICGNRARRQGPFLGKSDARFTCGRIGPA
jgi:hypothetical protein